MRISTLGYVGKQGVKNIWRNKMFSLASIATMSACIFLFGLFFSILVNFQYIIRSAEEGVAITVFFEPDATDEQKQEIGDQLRNHEGVSDVVYVSADEAWEEFQQQYFGDNTELAEGFKDGGQTGDVNVVGSMAAWAMERAIVRAVRAAQPACGLPGCGAL